MSAANCDALDSMTRRIALLNVRLAMLAGIGFALLAFLAFPLWRPLFVDDRVSDAFPDMMSDGEFAQLVSTIPVSDGSFVNGEGFYRTSGSASIYRLDDGSHILRLENFRTTNGPALHVYLSAAEQPRSSGEVGAFVDLGALRGNVGDQNYLIPAEVDLSRFHSVVIYCVPFARVFGSASLS